MDISAKHFILHKKHIFTFPKRSDMLNVVISKTGIQSPRRQDSISDSEINRLVIISGILVDLISLYFEKIWYAEC